MGKASRAGLWLSHSTCKSWGSFSRGWGHSAGPYSWISWRRTQTLILPLTMVMVTAIYYLKDHQYLALYQNLNVWEAEIGRNALSDYWTPASQIQFLAFLHRAQSCLIKPGRKADWASCHDGIIRVEVHYLVYYECRSWHMSSDVFR